MDRKGKTLDSSYLCTYDLYGPMRNAFDAGSIHYEGKWAGGWALEIETLMGPVKWRRGRIASAIWGPNDLTGTSI